MASLDGASGRQRDGNIALEHLDRVPLGHAASAQRMEAAQRPASHHGAQALLDIIERRAALAEAIRQVERHGQAAPAIGIDDAIAASDGGEFGIVDDVGIDVIWHGGVLCVLVMVQRLPRTAEKCEELKCRDPQRGEKSAVGRRAA